MPTTSSPLASSFTTPTDAEDILGQFYYALGQGAGTMPVKRAAIAALRKRYLGPIQAESANWKGASGTVLGFVSQVGRLAALFATQAGRTAITAADFMEARRIVEAGVHNRAESAGVFIAGPLCPTIPDETPAPAPEPSDRAVSDTSFVPTFATSGAAQSRPH